jgi:hypothetical protein
MSDRKELGAGSDRRVFSDQNYNGPERRGNKTRRTVKDRRKSFS